MKRLLPTLGLCIGFCFATVSPYGANGGGPGTPAPAAEALKLADLKVTGMMCPVGCVPRVRKALTGLPGVVSVDVALPDKAAVKYDPTRTSPEAMIQAIKKVGYEAEVRRPEQKTRP